MRRDRVLLHHHEDLDEGSNAGRGLTVTNVTFHGAQVEWAIRGPPSLRRREDAGDAYHLGTVASLRASAMHLDIVDIGGIDTGFIQDGS
jgi:hypothetical protein